MSGVVKLEALRCLAEHIKSEIPELRDAEDASGARERVVVVQVPPDQRMRFPSLAIVGGRYRFDRAQEEIVAQPTNHSAVACVGAWQTSVQLRLACATPAARYELEEKLTGLFFRGEDTPGLLLTEVTACPQLGNILAAWDLQEADWEEEMAFSSQEWAVLTLQGTIPALALREGVYTIEDLRLGVTLNFSTPATSAAFDGMPNVVRVNADGSVTPL